MLVEMGVKIANVYNKFKYMENSVAVFVKNIFLCIFKFVMKYLLLIYLGLWYQR